MPSEESAEETLRLTSKHENDIVPFFLWLAIAIVLSMIAFKMGVFVFDQLGYTSMTAVKVVGGGQVDYIQMKQSEYYAGSFVQIPVLLLTLGAFYIRDRRANHE